MSTTAQARLDAAVLQESDATTERLERLFSRLFMGLVYPQIWEDPVVDMTALQIAPGDNLVCIASGSCNMMSYLTAGPAAVTAVDLSPAHVALGRLKLAAARSLPVPSSGTNSEKRANDLRYEPRSVRALPSSCARRHSALRA